MKDKITSIQQLKPLFRQLDLVLVEPLDAYVIGGANLIAQGVHREATDDIDVIEPKEFPPSVQAAIEDLARKQGLLLKWMNTMPSSSERFLDRDWKSRTTRFFEGKRLKIFLVGRQDMIGLKLAASLDRLTPDRGDLLAMKPTEEEWETARRWAREYDANPDWPAAIDSLTEELKERQRRG